MAAQVDAVNSGSGATSGAEGRRIAYAAMRRAIAAGDLMPAQRLVEQDLADSYGVTRSSIRAALLRLSSEGLVERVPNRGSRVRVVTVEEAVDITEVRMQLECLLAAKAAERVTPEAAADLREIGDAMTAAVAGGDSLAYSQLNIRLHQLIRDLGCQPVAAELLDRLNGQLIRQRFRLSQREGRPRVSLGEHLEIIDAVVGGDAARASAAMHTHLRSVIAALQSTPRGQL